ncbi:MAG: adenine phosphoribosyltransferase [Deltaproteobacteria bacterium]|nr:adenine phosphoribosyltransferase [Deltaproteobacteria bacterium]MBW1962916.1 adenine phosphoribosyltransferase [Deltaproteobacteria bacterium]MBW1993871.1 adenine phosphoribosyltransferase [Deltaproteobacteria bacterium]MBW2150131.1 adenine phosphoribosyltransferase [Deltaproteobacteria bacterium]
MDIFSSLESGEKYIFDIPELGFKAELPYVLLPAEGGFIKIASLNLVGMIEWNRLFGHALARKIRETVVNLEGVVFFTAVEKALQLGQAVCQELGVPAMAIAYNRRKPHMEIEYGHRRPYIQVGAGSVTSGDKYLVVYERDVNLLSGAKSGVVIIDDVVSTGGTIAALATILDEVTERKSLDKRALKILGIYCVAKEGEMKPLYGGLSKKIHWLGNLPSPLFLNETPKE